MNLLFDSFWRALAYCLRPGVMVLSLLPLGLMGFLSLTWGYHYWDASLAWVRDALESFSLISWLSSWMKSMGLSDLQSVLAPVIVIFVLTPLIVIISLLTVALMMTPALTKMVAANRFPHLQRKQGGSWWESLWWSLFSTIMATLALLASLPLWLIPPFILILPPLIWGWLTYRVMAFDALAEHASTSERRELFRRHRWQMLGIGVFCGYLGAAPSLIWVSGALLAAAFVVLVPLAIWIYTLVFALSSLWFAHYCLAALQALRAESAHNTSSAVSSDNAIPTPHTTSLTQDTNV